MQRNHEMPFGAEILGKEETLFRLWAPDARQVTLLINGERLAMQAKDDGWHVLQAKAPAGTLYQFAIDDLIVPDPASRFNPHDVQGPSMVVDPKAYHWRNHAWQGRPWQEVVLYELHTGTFTPDGTFAAIKHKLDYLLDLGITAIELMPIADFPGSRGWGYDGVLPFAPEASYGTPDDLKDLIDTAHGKGLMVFLDVVYNHFGPEGNYLPLYASRFFNPKHQTPWGPAINYDAPGCEVVRAFFIHNALYWLDEYYFDGLRFDAVHAIADDSTPHILEELATTVRQFFPDRHIHLVLENDKNEARFLTHDEKRQPIFYNAQWNDDIHHAFHTLLTKENDGYYMDYSDAPIKHLGRCLAEGFAYQADPSPFRDGAIRGEQSAHLPPEAFVSFAQNHDQIGNRAFGERIGMLARAEALKTAVEVLLLSPHIPMLFMGEEFNADSPFLFFCDFHNELAEKVRQGRREEFARFARFSDHEVQKQIPDPNDRQTFLRSKLPWDKVFDNRAWLDHYQKLLSLRRQKIIPLMPAILPGKAHYDMLGQEALAVFWPCDNGRELSVFANFGEAPIRHHFKDRPFYASSDSSLAGIAGNVLAPYTVAWFAL